MKEFLKNLDPKKKNIILVVIATIISFLIVNFHLINSHTTTRVSAVDLILFSIFLIIVMFLSGFTVIEALFDVSVATCTSLFLAQTYCSSQRTPTEMQRLSALFSMGTLYVVVDFIKKLCKGIISKYEKIKDERWSLDKVLLVIFFIFYRMFLWALYEVIHPIVFSLCIYKK